MAPLQVTLQYIIELLLVMHTCVHRNLMFVVGQGRADLTSTSFFI